MMDIKTFSIKMDQKEAERVAQEKGGFLWRTVFRNSDLSEIRQHFIEFKLITFEAIRRPTIVERLLGRSEVRKQSITMLANGSTGSVAWVDSLPEIVSMEDVDENIVQLSDKDDKQLCNRGRKVALRVLHRFTGGIPELEVRQIESVFRPYWIALYGEVIEGNRVRYIPIAADGCGSHRSF